MVEIEVVDTLAAKIEKSFIVIFQSVQIAA